MNLSIVYTKIIINALNENRKKGGTIKYEEHHIFPKCLFPEWKNIKQHQWNGVLLTPREHFIVHVILAKIYKGSKLSYAPWKMACHNSDGRYKITSRTYERLRLEHIERMNKNEKLIEGRKHAKGKKQSEEHKKAKVESRKANGKPWLSDETKRNMSKPRQKVSSRKGRKFSTTKELEGIIKAIETKRNSGSIYWSEERKIKQSEKLKGKPGRPLTEERKQQLSVEKSKKIICPYCEKEGQIIIMKRWHFNNCKKKYRE